MKKETPWWLRNRKEGVVRDILEDLSRLEYCKEIEAVVDNLEFCKKTAYGTRCVVITFLHLKSKGFPIVLEDMVKYSRLNKQALLSAINKNRASFPYSSNCTLEYVCNVYKRVHCTTKQMGLIPVESEKEVIYLYSVKYFYSRSPFITCIYLCLRSMPSKEIAHVYRKIIPDASINALNIKKEMDRILIATGKEPEVKGVKTRVEKQKKIEQALRMYTTPLSEIKSYSTDYESLLIENLIKKNLSVNEIYNLTKKGMEYYVDWG